MPIQVEWFILADVARMEGGKLNLLGGGWNNVQPSRFPYAHHFGVAASLIIPPDEPQASHRMEIAIRAADGATLAAVPGEFHPQPGAQLIRELPIRAQFAVDVTIEFPAPGFYKADLSVDGRVLATAPFRIAEPQASGNPAQPPNVSDRGTKPIRRP